MHRPLRQIHTFEVSKEYRIVLLLDTWLKEYKDRVSCAGLRECDVKCYQRADETEERPYAEHFVGLSPLDRSGAVQREYKG